MLYTEQSLGAEIALIYRNPATSGFMEYEKADVKAGTTLAVIQKYCWTVYSKAYKASGPQVIGRLGDLHRSLREKISNIMEGQTLVDDSTQGNILKVDRWSLTVNDCWILGGIHRRADFTLMSGYTWTNAWSPDYNGFVVTGRELIGLQTFGYKPRKGASLGPGSQAIATFTPVDEALALASDLEDYHLAVALLESRGPMGAVNLINLGAATA